jgi:hypothetical protein
LNSELSKGVSSTNQPTPLASESMRIVPALGFPDSLKPVMVASASCPLGKSVIWKSMSSDVCDWSKSDQILVALSLMLETKLEVEL